MKKVLALILVLAMCLPLCACGKSEEVKNVESLISAIGAVSENSETAIVAAESAYNALTQDDKNKVSNYNTLLEARKTYNAIPKEIELTKDNIGEYITISGEYKNGDYHSSLFYYISTAELDFKAYSTVAGTFSNVEITVRANLSKEMGALSEKWHMADSEDKSKVQFTFKMPANGNYSTSYSIECDRQTLKLAGAAKLEIVSVSGTFKPNN